MTTAVRYISIFHKRQPECFQAPLQRSRSICSVPNGILRLDHDAFLSFDSLRREQDIRRTATQLKMAGSGHEKIIDGAARHREAA